MADSLYLIRYFEPFRLQYCLWESQSILDIQESLHIPVAQVKKLEFSVLRIYVKYTIQTPSYKWLVLLYHMINTRSFECELAAIFFIKFIVISEMRSTKENGTKKGKEWCVLKMRVNNSADEGSINYFHADWHLHSKRYTMNNFLKRSHW